MDCQAVRSTVKAADQCWGCKRQKRQKSLRKRIDLPRTMFYYNNVLKGRTKKKRGKNMYDNFNSQNAETHCDFWSLIAERYKAKRTVKGVFIGNVIMDWLYDTNYSLGCLYAETVLETWVTAEQYDKWLLSSMLNYKDIIKQIKTIYNEHADEIKATLGDGELDEINDFSADYYFAFGIGVPPYVVEAN